MHPIRVVLSSLVGRQDELDHLHARRRQASAGDGSMVLVSGEAGIGKSRLLEEFRRELSRARVRVACSQCSQFSGRPYAAILDALAELRSQRIADQAASQNSWFAEVSNAFRNATKSRAAVVLIEDIQWLDPASIELLWRITHDATTARLLVVVTYRTGRLSADHPATVGLTRLQTLPNCISMRLAPLAYAEVVRLIDEALRDSNLAVPYENRRAIAQLSEGNPLYAEELLKTTVERLQAGEPVRELPLSIRTAVMERLRPLSAWDQGVLAQAAVIGRRFSADLLFTTLAGKRDEILESLRRARNLQLVEEADALGDFRFNHALTREVIYESFLAAQVREFHVRIARTIEALPGDRRAVQELAYHYYAGGDRDKAAVYGEAAGDVAASLFAYDEAMRLYGYSLDSVDRRSSEAARLLYKLCFMQGRLGLKQLARDSIAESQRIYRALGDRANECEACIEHVAALFNLGDPEFAAPLVDLRSRLQAHAERPLQVRCDIALAQLQVLAGTGDPQALLDGCADELPDDPRVLCVYHAMRASLAARRGEVQNYVAQVEEARRHAQGDSLVNHRAVVLSNAAQALTDLGRFVAADRYFSDAMSVAEQHHLDPTAATTLAARARRRILAGALHEARADLLQAIDLAPQHAVPRPLLSGAGIVLGMSLDDEALLARCFGEDWLRGHDPYVAAAYAPRLASLGRMQEAQQLLHASLPSSADARIPFEYFIALARYGSRADEQPAADIVASLAARPEDVIYKATRQLFAALLADRDGEESARDASALSAASGFHDLGCPLYEALALEIAGRSDRAEALYREHKAVGDLRRLALSAGRTTQPVVHGGRGLTTREIEVVQFVGRGLSNAEIADRMSVSVKMVEKHLSSIYGKLGLNSRGKLMASLLARNQAAAGRSG